MQILHFILVALLVLPASAGAQARKPSTIAELVTYRGADREQLLYAGAKSRRQNRLVHIPRRRFLQGIGQGL